jgi:hypothetical protein
LAAKRGIKWLLEGDANTGFFHTIANGRRMKCRIAFLEDGDNIIIEQKELIAHINNFYRKLLGKEERGKVRMVECV